VFIKVKAFMTGGLRKLKLFSLTLLITVAIDCIRNFPASALFGSTLIFYFIFAAVVFLIPTALVSAELSANVNQGGIYQWSRLAFGERTAFLAIWLQWINNVVWFPTILSFIAGAIAYLINPALANNKYYLMSVVLIVFWGLTLVNIRGIRTSAKFTSFCTVAGLFIPMAFITVLLGLWLYQGNPVQIHFTWRDLFPNFHASENWIALTAIMLSYCGMELATVHINDVENPQKTFPRALALSTVIILVTMILGSLAIALIMPYNQINLVSSTVETFTIFLKAYHLQWLSPILITLIIIGSLGNVISWVISPIKGLGQAANQGYLPEFFQRENAHGVPQNLLLTQAVLVTFISAVFMLFPSVNGSYWLLSDLSTQLYVMMYVIMFLVGLKLRNHITLSKEAFHIPGNKIGSWTVGILGLIGCAITLFVGFIPPSSINIGSKLHYEIIFCAGLVIMLVPTLFFYYYAAKNNKLIQKNNQSEIAYEQQAN
jgi:amino acid transporter